MEMIASNDEMITAVSAGRYEAPCIFFDVYPCVITPLPSNNKPVGRVHALARHSTNMEPKNFVRGG